VPHVLAFLVVGAVLVFLDGWLLRRSGTTYLSAVYPDSSIADSVNQLIAVLFHLTGLGVVALLAALGPTAGDPFTTLVLQLGVLFLVLAAAHGSTLYALGRLRTRQRDKALQEEISSRTSERLDAR